MASVRSLVGVALLLGCVMAAASAEAQTTVGPAYVTRVVDGDTLYVELGGRLEVVRYLGVNTPRIEHPLYGPDDMRCSPARPTAGWSRASGCT